MGVIDMAYGWLSTNSNKNRYQVNTFKTISEQRKNQCRFMYNYGLRGLDIEKIVRSNVEDTVGTVEYNKGKYYYYDQNNGHIYRIDSNTGHIMEKIED